MEPISTRRTEILAEATAIASPAGYHRGMALSAAEREALLNEIVEICLSLKSEQDLKVQQRLTHDLRRLTHMLWVDADEA